MNTENTPSHHLARLDVVRGLAMLGVFFYHFYIESPGWYIPWPGMFASFANWHWYEIPLLPIAFGWLGVPLFFVLSGFCIHFGYLQRSTTFSTWDFFKRRFWRIYPAYFVSLIVFFILMPWIPYPYKGFQQLIPHLLLIHNLNKSTFCGVNGVYWTLGVEGQFYLLFPVLLWMCRRLSLTQCFFISLGLNVVSRAYISATHGMIDGPANVCNAFPLAIWCSWIIGACLAEGYFQKKPIFSKGPWTVLFFFLALLIPLTYKPVWTDTMLFASAFFAVAMEKYLQFRSSLNGLERLIAPVGVVSYSIYLWHQPIIKIVCEIPFFSAYTSSSLTHTLIVLPVVLLVTVPISILSYLYVERAVLLWSKARPMAQ